ncbi:MAG: MarR family transcriptional regulator [Beijerinckiaceae bacterium]|nr:MarR family transcriptional regulator [Beijerinckiaceae bacterium]
MTHIPDPPPPSFVLLNEIGIISQLAGAKLEAVLPFHISMAQFRILNHFVRLGGRPNINKLAQAFQVSKPTMGGIVEGMQRKELVSLTQDPDDRRSKIVAITAKGREAHALAVGNLAPELAKVEAAMGRDALSVMLPELQRLRRYLDQNR